AGCCCGKCGGGGYKAHSAKTHSLDKPKIHGLQLWEEIEPRSNYTYTQITNPNFLFARCCAERELPRACAAKCSHHTYTQASLHAMYLHLDGCPVSLAPEIQFCAAQGQDHRSCCTRRGVGNTVAGDKCIRLCDQRPDQYIQLDLSFAPCQEKFEDMKQCFYEGVRMSAKQLFYPGPSPKR
ncbi:hypothetical protein PFISCL1PPCAC_10441, partial [Pristionchus fissidentatus]